jgi:Concanavalin A-like lectin/glucanases superfamily
MVRRIRSSRFKRLQLAQLAPISVRGYSLSSGVQDFVTKVSAIEAANFIDFWTLGDLGGTTIVDNINAARNGVYQNSPALHSNLFADFVHVCPTFNGANQYGDVFSASLAAAFSLAEGTLMAPFYIAPEPLTDANVYVCASFSADASNEVTIFKNGQNTFTMRYIGGGITKLVSASVFSANGWHIPIATWSTLNNRFRGYIDGTQTGGDQTPLPTWVGSLVAGRCNIGAFAGPGFFFPGSLAMIGLWTKELTSAEVASASSALSAM